MDEAFTQGIEPGGLTTDYEIRILICHLIDQLKTPLTFTQINNALIKEGLVNYFELALAVSQLLSSGHLVELEVKNSPEKLLGMTDLGERTAHTFGKSIPLTVREKAVRAIRENMLRERIEKENQVTIEKTSDGYRLTLCISDVGTDLLNLSAFVPTLEHCEEIKERFLKDPTVVYRGVIALLTGEKLEASGEGQELL